MGNLLIYQIIPHLVSDSELNQSAHSQEPHFISSPEEEVESSFYSSTEVNENDPKSALKQKIWIDP